MAAAAARVGGDVVMNLKSLRGLGDTSTFFKNMDNVPVDALRGISKSDMTDLLKGFDDVQLAKIGKKLDPKYVEGMNPALAAKLKPPTLISKSIDGVKLLSTNTVNGVKRLRTKMGGNISAFKKKVGWSSKKADDATEAMKKGNKKSLEDAADEVAEAAPSAAKEGDATVRGSKEGREGLMKTGLYVTGGVLLAMMMYDTLNPFEAIHKAVKETGQVVRGLKEVAEESAEVVLEVAGAAGGAAGGLFKGGFNFISFITNNSGLSSSSSILCLILIFAAVMMSFLGGSKK